MRKLFLSALFAGCLAASTEAQQYWYIQPDANSICWKIRQGENHTDHIEMAGKRVATVLRYGICPDGTFRLNKSLIWPMLRTLPNDTHASLMRRFDWNPLDALTVNGRSLNERVDSVVLNGTLQVHGTIATGRDRSLSLERTFFPAVDVPALIEVYRFTNNGDRTVVLEAPLVHSTSETPAEKGVDGSYRIHFDTSGGGAVRLNPGDSFTYYASISAFKHTEQVTDFVSYYPGALKKRAELVDGWMQNLVLETPDEVLNKMFAFSKIRACESIYETKDGPMHGPGGESYYAAIWANDQAEYINPYFPFVGYEYGNASARNSFRQFATYMNDRWERIPSSIIAEGDTCWSAAGDRGDAAMVAYGASRFALAGGSAEEARKLWPLIEWCLEFCRRKINEGGVVASDSDELEGRFPSGKANLCTSSLYYDALLSAAYLADDLGKKMEARAYRRQAFDMREAIDRYFAASVEGYDTYAYYQGNDVLRAWICIPLTVGIYTRAEGTVDALFSSRLWTDNGLLTQAGTQTFWDRSTLYALRGVFQAGEVERAMKFLKFYSNTRLLGKHVPYAVEAWPEGNQRHLSAESALYGRIMTEGLFGIRPTGLRSFSMVPRLPKVWSEMALRKVKAFGADFDVEVSRLDAQKIRVTVRNEGRLVLDKKIRNGEEVRCKLK